MTTLSLALGSAALLCVLAAAAWDVWRFEIPDTLSIVIVALAIPFGFLQPDFAWLSHIAAPVLVFGFGLLAFSRGWLGGGDVKVLTATAAWTGLAGLPVQWAVVALAGGLLTVVLIGLRAVLARGGRDTGHLPRIAQKDAPLPYAVAIAAGTFWWAWLVYAGR